jgi:hypothetical protein
MAETKKKLPLFGHEIDVSVVPIKKAEENFTRYELEDGSTIKVKNVMTSVLRVDNQWLPDGNPVYIVLSTPVVGVEGAILKRPATPDPDKDKIN